MTRDPDIVLRNTALADLPLVVAWESHPDNAAFVEVWPEERHRAALDDRSLGHLIIEAEGRPVGFVLLAGADDPATPVEFRRIVVAEKGRGFGKAAVRHVVRYVFGRLGATVVWLDFVVHNRRARHVYEACGFRMDSGPRRSAEIGGKATPLITMRLSRTEFERREGGDG